jgi:transporter family-2 protein
MTLYATFALVIGAVISIHMSMNAQVGLSLGNARLANIFFWASGFLAAVLLALPRQDFGLVRRLPQIPWWLFLAGVLGACISLFVSISIPRIGAINLTILLLTGQLIASTILSDRGWLGSERSPLSWWKLLGMLVMVLGTALVLYGDRIFGRHAN